MKNRILLFIFVFLTSFLCSCQGKQYTLLLGDFSNNFISEMKENFNGDVNNYFARKDMQSGELFKIVDSNASYYDNKTQYPFFGVTEKAKNIVINFGLSDFVPSMKIDESKKILEYDKDLFDHQLEIFQYHAYHIVEDVKEINSKANIFLLSAYSKYTFEKPEQLLFNSLVKEVNTELVKIASEHKVTYISLVDINDEIASNPSMNINSFILERLRGALNE